MSILLSACSQERDSDSPRNDIVCELYSAPREQHSAGRLHHLNNIQIRLRSLLPVNFLVVADTVPLNPQQFPALHLCCKEDETPVG